MTRFSQGLIGAGCALMLTACGQSSPTPAAHPPAATVANARPEGDLTTVTLSPEAQNHLALQMKTVAIEAVSVSRTVGAEVIVPPGRLVTVSAPVAGTLSRGPAGAVGPVKRGDILFHLVPLQQSERDVRAEADRQLQEADARLTQATQRVQRLELLLKDGSTSARSVEEAQADRAVANAAAVAARQRVESAKRLPSGADGALALPAPFDGFLTNLHVADGQIVAAGAGLADVSQTRGLWVRAPVFTGDIGSIDTSQPVTMAGLGRESSGPWHTLRRVTGPPSANAAAASLDLFYELTGGGEAVIRPGERVVIRLPLKSTSRALVVPQAAIIYDINGGTWVYEQRAANQFARRRVELGGAAGSGVIVLRGLTEGLTIVTVGAAELYGTEFYVSK